MTTTTDNALCLRPATELRALLLRRELSARELLELHLSRVDRLNPQLNAIVTHTRELAFRQADACDAALGQGGVLGPLHGLPMAHKDLLPMRGVRSTRGSPIFANEHPDHDALIIERMQRAGGVCIGKTNTPEFGAGSHTFNTVFGATRNPWDQSRTCGGSSGGAAVALASGMVAVADGSDLGGSLRNPGNFNHVVGLRPTLGRVPAWPEVRGYGGLAVLGPMGRTVEDVALLLSAIAGPDARAPHARQEPGQAFYPLAERSFRGARVAWSPDLGGLPLDPRVRTALEAARPALTAIGVHCVAATPDFSGAEFAFHTLRAYAMTDLAPLLRKRRDEFKATVVWNIEKGLALTAEEVGRAESLRTTLYHRMRAFLAEHDFLLCCVNQVPPFAIDVEYPTEIDGTPMHDYIEWMRSCWIITVTGHPALSLPVGFTAEGLPVGLQIVGRYGDERGLLQFARALERELGLVDRHPPG